MPPRPSAAIVRLNDRAADGQPEAHTRGRRSAHAWVNLSNKASSRPGERISSAMVPETLTSSCFSCTRADTVMMLPGGVPAPSRSNSFRLRSRYDFLERQPFDAGDQPLGLGPAMGLDHADQHVGALLARGACGRQHRVGLADACRGAEVDLELAPASLGLFLLDLLEQGVRVGRSASITANPPLEAPVQQAADNRDQHQRERIAKSPLELRHVLEVHAPDAGKGGGGCEDTGPGGELLGDLALLQRDHGEIDVDRGGDRVAHRVDGGIEPDQVVVHVAEVLSGFQAQARHAPPEQPGAASISGATACFNTITLCFRSYSRSMLWRMVPLAKIFSSTRSSSVSSRSRIGK